LAGAGAFFGAVFFGTAFSGFSRQRTRILPMDCTACAWSLSQSCAIHAERASRSSVAAFTLMSSWAFSARSTSATTDSVSPLSPMITTGDRAWAWARNSLRRAGVRLGMREL
jgi:hypothetical protein